MPEELAGPYRATLTRLQESGPRWAPTGCTRSSRASSAALGEHEARRVRRRAGRRGLDRPGAQGRLARRARGRGQDPVPRRRRGAAVRPQPARPRGPRGRVVGARHRRQADHGRAQGPDERGARLPPRGPQPAALRDGLPRRRRRPRARRAGRLHPRPRHRVGRRHAASRIITSGTQEERDEAATLYLEFLLRARTARACCTPTRTPATSASPTTAGSAVLDFGAVNRLPDGLPTSLGWVLTEALAGDAEALEAGLRRRASSARASTSTPRRCSRTSAPSSSRCSTRSSARRGSGCAGRRPRCRTRDGRSSSSG